MFKKLANTEKVLFLSDLIFKMTIYLRGEYTNDFNNKENGIKRLHSVNEMNHLFISKITDYLNSNFEECDTDVECFWDYIEEKLQDKLLGDIFYKALNSEWETKWDLTFKNLKDF